MPAIRLVFFEDEAQDVQDLVILESCIGGAPLAEVILPGQEVKPQDVCQAEAGFVSRAKVIREIQPGMVSCCKLFLQEYPARVRLVVPVTAFTFRAEPAEQAVPDIGKK